MFGALMEVPGVVVTISFWLGESFSNSLQKRLAMITACSRVAVPDGERCALPEPSAHVAVILYAGVARDFRRVNAGLVKDIIENDAQILTLDACVRVEKAG